jgi:hypothetical protein
VHPSAKGIEIDLEIAALPDDVVCGAAP